MKACQDLTYSKLANILRYGAGKRPPKRCVRFYAIDLGKQHAGTAGCGHHSDQSTFKESEGINTLKRINLLFSVFTALISVQA
ncbi:hypothetical protein KIN20_023892 [Parelaphostrongylus tenuis]|uniref:Uncharacterized protein n=1 Tax=Parelaphostrongylus tenuis TaxID=148309 RepID=A0AAD5QWE1_PARTN|nr:hypothetical protein KIN20_023892 [Parelaphostrongylus tenuis]